ncbi:MAG: hypothetical protein IPL31_10555 [Saprospiraceae bacterium]|nr:hypothetical protein [Saprospiraceae bacterium]
MHPSRKVQFDSIVLTKTGGHYTLDIIAATDYYPFGMAISGRTNNAGKYRFGFNGKENDNEVKGNNVQQDYGMRFYDTRVGRFLSVDPKAEKFPYASPYNFVFK